MAENFSLTCPCEKKECKGTERPFDMNINNMGTDDDDNICYGIYYMGGNMTEYKGLIQSCRIQ